SAACARPTPPLAVLLRLLGKAVVRPRWFPVRLVPNLAGFEKAPHGGFKGFAGEPLAFCLVLMGKGCWGITRPFFVPYDAVFRRKTAQQVQEDLVRFGLLGCFIERCHSGHRQEQTTFIAQPDCFSGRSVLVFLEFELAQAGVGLRVTFWLNALQEMSEPERTVPCGGPREP